MSFMVWLTTGHHIFVFGLLACCLSSPIASTLVRATPKFTAEIPRTWNSPSTSWLPQTHLLSELMDKRGPCHARGEGGKEMLMKMLSPCAKALEDNDANTWKADGGMRSGNGLGLKQHQEGSAGDLPKLFF